MFLYRHRQVGFLHWVVLPAFLLTLGVCLAAGAGREPAGLLIVGFVGAVLTLVSVAFRHLDTEVTDTDLHVRFGPLGLASKTVPLRSIRDAQAGRSILLDGWGIHWRPSAGWIWNVAGRDTVELVLDDGRLRVGTDDVDGLLEALERARSAA